MKKDKYLKLHADLDDFLRRDLSTESLLRIALMGLNHSIKLINASQFNDTSTFDMILKITNKLKKELE